MELANDNFNIELLQLNSHLKKVIYRAKNIQDLLFDICNIITDNSIFDTAAIISNIDNTAIRYHSKHNKKYLAKEEPPLCFSNAMESSKTIELVNKPENCRYCEIQCKTPVAYTFARALEYEDYKYGVLIITTDSSSNYSIKCKQLICDIADDIAFAIHNLLIKQELLQHKRAYKKSKENFKTIFDKAPVGMTIVDNNGIIKDVNAAECKLLLYEREELIGKHISMHFFPDFLDSFHRFFDKLIENGELEATIKLRQKSGSSIMTRRSARVIYSEDGSVNKIIIHTQDITTAYKSTNKLHTLFQAIEQSPSIFVITDINNNISYVNKKFEEVTGYTYKESVGKNPKLLKSNYVSSNFYKKIWETLANNEAWMGRFHNQRKDGNHYWELAKISKLYNKEGVHSGYIKTGEDITKFVDIEEKLEQSNRSYINIFELIPIPVILHDGKKIININNAAVEFGNGGRTGENFIPKEKYINTPVINFVHPTSRKNVAERIQAMKSSDKKQPLIEELFYNSNKDIRNVEVTSRKISFQGKETFMVAFHDITDRIEKTRELLESEYKFQEIFNTNPDAITISRLSTGEIIDINPGFTRHTGYTKDETIGKTVFDLNLYHNINDRDIVANKLKKNGRIDNFEIKFKIKDDKVLIGLISARIITINNENFNLFVVRNISKRKQMEEELIQAKNKAEENDRLKSAFLANMSHEIRNPMNAIIGFSELLKDNKISTDERNNFIDIIHSKGNDLLVIIKDIIDISKVEAGVLEINCKPTSLNSLIAEVSKIYSPIFRKKNKISFEIQKNYEENNDITIFVDQSRFHQIINNLIDNAIKFTEKGIIKLLISNTDNEISISVSDTGIGIPEDNLEIIFQRFIQINNTHKKLDSGSGLGLCITRSLVKMMNGEISVKSQLGVGSKFTFTLPIATKTNNLDCTT